MRLLLILVALSLAAPVRAENCSDAQIQADARLNRLYREIQQRLKNDPATAKLLTVAQQAWIAYRDAESGFSSIVTIGGSIHNMVEAQCLTGQTETRIKDFTAYLNCQEGGLSCPLPRQ